MQYKRQLLPNQNPNLYVVVQTLMTSPQVRARLGIMTATEAAAYLNISRNLLSRWVDQGVFPPPEQTSEGGYIKCWHKATVEAFEANNARLLIARRGAVGKPTRYEPPPLETPLNLALVRQFLARPLLSPVPKSVTMS